MFETQGGPRNGARDLPKKGSAFHLIMPSEYFDVNVDVNNLHVLIKHAWLSKSMPYYS